MNQTEKVWWIYPDLKPKVLLPQKGMKAAAQTETSGAAQYAENNGAISLRVLNLISRYIINYDAICKTAAFGQQALFFQLCYRKKFLGCQNLSLDSFPCHLIWFERYVFHLHKVPLLLRRFELEPKTGRLEHHMKYEFHYRSSFHMLKGHYQHLKAL